MTIPIGIGFDAGGIGKGLAADLVATELIAEGVGGVCVNIGGDLRVIGESPSGDGLDTGDRTPTGGRADCARRVGRGAIATSSVLRQDWTRDGRPPPPDRSSHR